MNCLIVYSHEYNYNRDDKAIQDFFIYVIRADEWSELRERFIAEFPYFEKELKDLSFEQLWHRVTCEYYDSDYDPVLTNIIVECTRSCRRYVGYIPMSDTDALSQDYIEKDDYEYASFILREFIETHGGEFYGI